jgi:ketosteroid isomerase-like protein
MSLAAFDSQQLDQFIRRFEDLFYAGDPASMTSYYTKDAQLMADGTWRIAVDISTPLPG